ncbi:lycopene cyclase domain-containing protein [Brachybacterium sp. JHP9]|uniref:Lycopene cyclase domain-containing protein n=1 Tax=Brachybacterium equifaecis TaxID=2910770 RepID=A0ABT0QYB9_9MICO|nr:lycopene cyclase domain-containing protein [Brachybacterium equifaecis]MCL6422514.1 lycopene cyclase domain-containing protein [Brachybacterium equifaecis]
MPEYTLLTVLGLVLVVLLELLVLRTGIFRSLAYWLSMAIIMGFQVLVDGWLTKLHAPIVLYEESQTLGIRFPFDIPIEDFGFGAAMVTMTMALWLKVTRPERAPRGAA